MKEPVVFVLNLHAEAFAVIMGSREKVFRAGSKMQLVCILRHILKNVFNLIIAQLFQFLKAFLGQVCIVKNITEPPSYVFWYHNSRMINYGVGGVEVVIHIQPQ